MSAKYPEWWELPMCRWYQSGHNRDSRKQKLYSAENRIFLYSSTNNRKFESLDEISVYIQDMINDPWIRKRWSSVCDKNFKVSLHYAEKGTAWARMVDHAMWLPKWAWNEQIVLHEFAHLLSPVYPSYSGPSHGRYFARTYLELVGHKMGDEIKKELRRQYVLHGVQFQPIKAISPEKLQQMKERGRRLAGLNKEK